MALCTLLDVTHGYGGAPLLDGVSFQVEERERVCLLGRNGAGKSTLLKLIAGEIQPDSGGIFPRPGARFARLAQEVPHGLAGDVREVVAAGLRPAEETHEEDWQRDDRVDRTIERLGLEPAAEFGRLSGGLKRRALLGQALVSEPDLLLLDEPTNHLDVASIEWLETFLAGSSLALFFVTHDRAFLQAVATRIIELDRGRLTNWDCDYATYLGRKEAWLEAEERQRAAFDKKLAQEEAWVRRGVRAQRTRAQARIAALERLRAERRARRDREGQATLAVAEAERSGFKVIEADRVTFAHPGGRPLVQDWSLTIQRGDKLGLVGPNGAGKTTLLRLLLGQLQPTRGEVRQGTGLEVVYLDQLRAQIDDTKTVAENINGGSDTVTVGGRTRHVISYLQDFLFAPDRARSPARVLSGGERNRLLLARLFTRPANLLVLDEPTNDLDLETLDLLEDLVVEFAGTVLVVSHDRRFLDEVATGILWFDGDGRITEHVGGYGDAVADRMRRAAAAAAAAPPAAPPGPRPRTGAPRRLTGKEERELAELPGRIEVIERAQAERAATLADPGTYQRNPKAAAEARARLAELETEYARLFARWEELEKIRAATLR